MQQVQADALHLFFGFNEFSAIHCKNVLVHVPDKFVFFKILSRVLQPNGRVLLVSAPGLNDDHQYSWTPGELERVAARYGLQLVTMEEHQLRNDDWYKLNQDATIIRSMSRKMSSSEFPVLGRSVATMSGTGLPSGEAKTFYIRYRYPEAKTNGEFASQYFHLPCMRNLVEYLQSIPSPKILDLGSGGGYELQEFKRRVPGITPVGLEISNVGVRETVEKRLMGVQAIGTELPFSNNYFSCIHCKDVLVHIPDKDQLLSELYRVLEPGGVAIVVSASAMPNDEYQVEWSTSDFADLAQKNSFIVIDSGSVTFQQDDWYFTSQQQARHYFVLHKT